MRKRNLFLVAAAALLAAASLAAIGKTGPESLVRETSAKAAPREGQILQLAETGNGKADNIGMALDNEPGVLGSVAISSSEDAWQVTVVGKQITDVACRNIDGDFVVSMRVAIPENQNDYNAGILAGNLTR